MAIKPPLFNLPATVHVEQRHIDAGLRGNCRNCPIALAAQDALGTPQLWASANGVEWITDWPCSEIVLIGKLPDEALKFMSIFDYGNHVAPFSFVLEAP